MKKSIVSLFAAAALSSSAFAQTLITSDTTWSGTVDITDQIVVTGGATLTIEPGTVVRAIPAGGAGAFTTSNGAVHIAADGFIESNGTETSPVIFTYENGISKDENALGGGESITTKFATFAQWGGLSVNGEAPICDSQLTEAMEGLTVGGGVTTAMINYGGLDPADTSGSITYTSLRYGGSVLALNNELNGLSMGGVGSGTTVSYVEVINNIDDGIEIWGGDVNTDHILIYGSGDDSFDIDEGHLGNHQFALVINSDMTDGAAKGSGTSDHGMEMDGFASSGCTNASGRGNSDPIFYNLTLVGRGKAGSYVGQGSNDAINVKQAMGGEIHYSIFYDFGGPFFNEDDDAGTATTEVHDTLVYAFSGPLQDPANPVAFTNTGLINQISSNVGDIDDPFSITRTDLWANDGSEIVTSFDPRPIAGSAADVTLAAAPAPFVPVTFIGAFSSGYNWLLGWSAIEDLGIISGSNTATNTSIGAAPAVTFDTAAGSFYTISSSANPSGPFTVVDTVEGTGSPATFVDSGAASALFYQVEQF